METKTRKNKRFISNFIGRRILSRDEFVQILIHYNPDLDELYFKTRLFDAVLTRELSPISEPQNCLTKPKNRNFKFLTESLVNYAVKMKWYIPKNELIVSEELLQKASPQTNEKDLTPTEPLSNPDLIKELENKQLTVETKLSIPAVSLNDDSLAKFKLGEKVTDNLKLAGMKGAQASKEKSEDFWRPLLSLAIEEAKKNKGKWSATSLAKHLIARDKLTVKVETFRKKISANSEIIPYLIKAP